ncbi:MAG TPA: oxidoreductase [Hyphomonadaceae bacterium]|nr:oxidoreductase [Hyphomonadaceae bacterium]
MELINQGQGDVRSLIRPNVKQPEAPSVSAWEHGTLLTLPEWLARDGASLAAPVGIVLMPTDDPLALAGHLDGVTVIAVEFAKFSDGRGYSIATLLRSRLGFKGEIRGVGDVLIDQLFAMARCGIDSFALRGDQDVEAAKRAFETFPAVYQWAADERDFVLATQANLEREAA